MDLTNRMCADADPRLKLLNARRPLVVYSDGLGDTLMSLPALRALSDLFRQRLTLVASAQSRKVVEGEISFRDFIERTDDNEVHIAHRIGSCDLLMTADPDPESHFSGELIRLLSPACSIGWAANHHILLSARDGRHFSDEVFDLPRFLDSALVMDTYCFAPRLGQVDNGLARAICDEIPTARRILVVHPDTMASKMWPLDRFRAFLDLFLAAHPEFLALVVGLRPASLDLGRLGDHVIPCHGLPLATSIALVASADLFVGMDSSMLHAADMYRIPSVGIFGPSCPRRWGCRFTRHRHVVARSRNIADVRAEDVLRATESLWDEVVRSG